MFWYRFFKFTVVRPMVRFGYGTRVFGAESFPREGGAILGCGTITGAGASSYTTPGDACGGATLAAGATCDIAARFNPFTR